MMSCEAPERYISVMLGNILGHVNIFFTARQGMQPTPRFS
jgi:hypothetical protein